MRHTLRSMAIDLWRHATYEEVVALATLGSHQGIAYRCKAYLAPASFVTFEGSLNEALQVIELDYGHGLVEKTTSSSYCC
jgi:hypothetical protein